VLELLKNANTQSIVFCEGKEVPIDDHHTMISVGFANRTPWKTPREVDDADLGTMIEALAGGVADANPPSSLLATLLVAPIAWTSLQWATYSAQQNGEIKGARSFQNQLVIILGSLIATGVLLAALAAAFQHGHRHRVLIRGGRRLLGRIGARQVQRSLSLAEHRGHGSRRQPDHRGAHSLRLHPQRLPDRQQLLYRHDPRHGGHVARSAVARMGEPGSPTSSTRRSMPTSRTSWPASR
jgi:hypothetical protein